MLLFTTGVPYVVHLGKEYLAGTFGVKGIQRCSFVHQNQGKSVFDER